MRRVSMSVVIYNKNQEFDASWCDEVVNVMRPHILGNPFPITRARPRHEVIRAYRDWLEIQLKTDSVVRLEVERLVRLHAAGGAVGLVCCCTPLPCHADAIKSVIESMALST